VTEPIRRGLKWLNSLNHFLALALLLALATWGINGILGAQTKSPNFRVIAMAEARRHSQAICNRAKVWLGKLASDNNFTVDYIEDTEKNR